MKEKRSSGDLLQRTKSEGSVADVKEKVSRCGEDELRV